MHPHTFLLAELVDEQLGLDVGVNPVNVLGQVGFGEGDLLIVEELAELLHHSVIHFETLATLWIACSAWRS